MKIKDFIVVAIVFVSCCINLLKLANIQMIMTQAFPDQYSLHFSLFSWRHESSSLEIYCQIIESTCPNFLLLTAQWWYFILKASFEYWVPMGLSMICVCSSLFLPNVEGAKYLTRIDVLVPKTFLGMDALSKNSQESKEWVKTRLMIQSLCETNSC